MAPACSSGLSRCVRAVLELEYWSLNSSRPAFVMHGHGHEHDMPGQQATSRRFCHDTEVQIHSMGRTRQRGVHMRPAAENLGTERCHSAQIYRSLTGALWSILHG